jgi:hypothetical protein
MGWWFMIMKHIVIQLSPFVLYSLFRIDIWCLSVFLDASNLLVISLIGILMETSLNIPTG